MAEGSTNIIKELPSTSGAEQTSASVESGLGGLLGSLGSFAPDNPKSPLFAVASSLGEVSTKLNFNPEPLKKLYPDALYVMKNALPADSLEYVASIEEAYRTAQEFLQGSALAREIKDGASLQDVALAAIKDALRLFDERQIQLHQNLVDPKTLKDFTDTIAAFARFRDDFPAHADEFLPFITRQLFGLDPNILKDPLAYLAVSLSVLDPLDPAAVEAAIGAAQKTVNEAFSELAQLVATFDAADPAAYVLLEVRLSALDAAVRALHTAVTPVYQTLQTAVGAHAWDVIFPHLKSLFEAVTFEAPPTVDDAIHALSKLFERMLAGLGAVAAPQEIVTRTEAMCTEFYNLFASSSVGQLRRLLRDFLGKIQKALASVPTENVQKAVEEMLARVKEEIDKLGIADIAETIENGFQEAETFITGHIDEALKEDVRTAVQALLDGMKELPLETLFGNINAAVEKVQNLLNELDKSLKEGVEEVKELLAKLEELSFAPVGSAIIAEIDDLKKRIKSMNPNALSDVEKLAIKAALAFLEGFDLENIIETKAKEGFDKARDAVKPLLDDLEAVLRRLRQQLEAYDPARFVATLNELLDDAKGLADKLDAKRLLKPLFEQVDEFVERLEALSPGSLLDPLVGPYKEVVGVVNQLQPERLIAPLNALYEEVDKLIDAIDITPVMEELDRRQKALFKNASDDLLAALDGLDLPSPFKEFFAEVRPAVASMTAAIFEDPGAGAEKVSRSLPPGLDITGVFKPLDKVFDELMKMVAGVPADDLVAVFETLRRTVGVGLGALDPRQIVDAMRQGQRRLEELSPRLLYALPLSLPALRVTFEARVETAPNSRKGDVTAALLHFDAVIKLTSPTEAQSLLAELNNAHANLLNTLRARVNSLDATGAEAAYGLLRDQLARVLPDFLQQPDPLTFADVLAGLETLRPSHRAAELKRVFDRFLQQLRPLQAAVEEAGRKFFKAIRDVLDLINPLAVKDAVADIYKTVHEKVRILDPEKLAAALRTSIFEPVEKALKALDPAALKERLNEAYRKVLKAIVDNIRPILDDIAEALDEQLTLIRESVKKILDDIKATIGQAKEIFDGMVKQVEDLVFVEVLDRLRRVLDNLGVSFDKELSRVRKAFDEMLAALPLDIGPKKASASVAA
jgi:hypothetical protein